MGEDRQTTELRRITQLGLNQAAEMLSRLLRQQVRIDVAGSWSSDCASWGAEDSPQVGVYVGVCGELQGGFLLILSEERARAMTQQMLGVPVAAGLTEEPASSTLREIGNIIASAFLASIDDQLGLRALPEPPQLNVAPLDALLGKHQSNAEDVCLVVRTDLIAAESGPLEGAIFLLPKQSSLDLLKKRIEQSC